MSIGIKGEAVLRELKCIHKTLKDRECELNARLELVLEATRNLASCRDRNELNRKLVEIFAHHMAAEGGSLFICSENQLELAHSLDPEHVPASLPLPLPEESILNQVLQSGKPILIRDIEKEKILRPSGWKGYKNGSLLAFPLTDETGNIKAVLSLHNKKWPPFTLKDLDLGQILSSLCIETVRCLQTKEYFKELIENSSDLISVVDADGSICHASPSVLQILGYQPAEMVGTQASDYLHPEDVERVRQLFESGIAKTGKVRELTFRYRHKNGSWLTVAASAKNALHIEAIKGFVINARDITEQLVAQEQVRRQEQQLVKAAKLASLGTLVSGMAHEINNPNNFIRLISHNLQDFWADIEGLLLEKDKGSDELKLAGIPYPTARQMMQKMFNGLEEGSKRIEGLIEKLKEYARVDSGELDQTVNLHEVLESSLTTTRGLIRSCTRNFSIQASKELPPVKGSFRQIEQVLVNLITNACQALTYKQQRIAISVYKHEAKQKVIALIRDEGSGIPEDQLSKITDPFYTTRREMGATGLGLSICHRIAQNHGGELLFESQPGKGTTVRFCLPAGENDDVS